MEDSVFNKYLDEIGKEALLSDDEERNLSERIRQGDQRALSKLVEANLRFVVTIARQYRGQGVEMEDVYDVEQSKHIMQGKVLDKDHYTAAIVKYLAEKFKGEQYKIERMIVYTYDTKWRVDGKKPKPYTYVVVSQKVRGLGNKLKFTRMEFDAGGNFTGLLAQPIDKNDIQ